MFVMLRRASRNKTKSSLRLLTSYQDETEFRSLTEETFAEFPAIQLRTIAKKSTTWTFNPSKEKLSGNPKLEFISSIATLKMILILT